MNLYLTLTRRGPGISRGRFSSGGTGSTLPADMASTSIAPSAAPAATTLIYGIPLWYRLFLAAIAVVVAGALAVSGGDSILGWLMLVVTVLAALYEERWTFDRESGQATARMGLLVAAKGPGFPLTDIERLRLDTFVKGRLDQSTPPPDDKMPRGSQARLIMDTRSGESYMIDSVSFGARQRLRETAEELSRFLGVPLD